MSFFYMCVHLFFPPPQDLTNTLEEAELHIVWLCLWGRSCELVVKLVATEGNATDGATLQELWQSSLAGSTGREKHVTDGHRNWDLPKLT
jgi:hypothetical protein